MFHLRTTLCPNTSPEQTNKTRTLKSRRLRGPRYIYCLQTESRHRCTARAPCCFSNLHSCISINHISKKWKTGHFRVLRISSREGANVLYHSLGAPLKINIFEIWRQTAGQYFPASAQSLDYCLWWFSPSSSHFHTWRFINLFKVFGILSCGALCNYLWLVCFSFMELQTLYI